MKAYSPTLQEQAQAVLHLMQEPQPEPVSLRAFVESTTNHTLDDWQVDLCARLEALADTTGRRLLIHAPPQMGKSIIVSQRFPAWLLTRKPQHRVKLACYNVTHATRFGRIVRDLMQSREFAAMFPDTGLRIPAVCSAEEWSTSARAKTRDSQPSFKALGLATGFVGQGADTLLIDDPYASPDDAYSVIINAKVHSFWTDTARPRLNDNTNVVVMFHRYTENDLAGYLMETEPDEWELVRYAGQSDGNYEHPVTKKEYLDPLQRGEGQYLSSRFSENWYEKQRANGFVWLSQFQGRPTSKEGEFFKIAKLDTPLPAAPANLRTWRAWDLAASAGKGDYTAGVKLGTDASGMFYVLDVQRGQWSSDQRNAMLRQTSSIDGKATKIRLAQDPGQAGKEQAEQLIRMLAGYSVKAERVSGDKVTRADGFAAQVNAGNVRLVAGAWNAAFIEELRQFPNGKHDDQCLVAGTLIRTIDGEKPIEKILAGDLVATRSGFRRVSWAGMTNPNARVLQLTLSNGKTLKGTANHPVFIENKGFVLLDSVCDGDIIRLWQNTNQLDTKASYSGDTLSRRLARIAFTLFQGWQTKNADLTLCIEKFTRTISGQSRQAITSIIRMMTRLITTPQTLSPSLRTNIGLSIWSQQWPIRAQPNNGSICLLLENPLRLGTKANRATNGTENTANLQRQAANLSSSIAPNAESNLSQKLMEARALMANVSVQETARQEQGDVRDGSAPLKPAPPAVRSLWGSRALNVAPVSVVRVCAGIEPVEVYNLTVEGEHEYFANDVLVHNCDAVSDAFNELAQNRKFTYGTY